MVIRPKPSTSNIKKEKKKKRKGNLAGETAKHCGVNYWALTVFHIYDTDNNLFGLQELQQPEKWNKAKSPALCL